MGDASLAHLGEYPQEIGEPQHFLHARAKVDEPQFASGALAGYVDPHQRAQTHAVDPFQICKVEHNHLTAWNQPANLVIEKAAHPRYEPAAAVHDALLAFTLDLYGQGSRTRLSWHKRHLAKLVD